MSRSLVGASLGAADGKQARAWRRGEDRVRQTHPQDLLERDLHLEVSCAKVQDNVHQLTRLACRPELVTDPTKDYAVSAVDPYESSLQPSSLASTSTAAQGGGQGLMEGKGMLSWNLAEKREGTTWVCGRVMVDEREKESRARKKRRTEGGATAQDEEDEEDDSDDESVKETLEVWLQLVEVGRSPLCLGSLMTDPSPRLNSDHRSLRLNSSLPFAPLPIRLSRKTRPIDPPPLPVANLSAISSSNLPPLNLGRLSSATRSSASALVTRMRIACRSLFLLPLSLRLPPPLQLSSRPLLSHLRRPHLPRFSCRIPASSPFSRSSSLRSARTRTSPNRASSHCHSSQSRDKHFCPLYAPSQSTTASSCLLPSTPLRPLFLRRRRISRWSSRSLHLRRCLVRRTRARERRRLLRGKALALSTTQSSINPTRRARTTPSMLTAAAQIARGGRAPSGGRRIRRTGLTSRPAMVSDLGAE